MVLYFRQARKPVNIGEPQKSVLEFYLNPEYTKSRKRQGRNASNKFT